MFKKREKKTKILSLEQDSAEIDAKDYTESNISTTRPVASQLDNFLNKKRTDFSSKEFTSDTDKAKELMDDLKYKSSYSLQNRNDATKEIEIDTERDKDARAIIDRNMKISKDKLQGKIAEDSYMGKSATIIYAEKSEKDLSRYKVTGTMGPLRAPSNVRITCRFDYAPGICKDYKETGYCGFGDGCVFMHDRGDYKSGWEIEEEWKQQQKKKEKLTREGKYNEDNSDDSYNEFENESNIPMKCQKCENDFVSPISTICEHYFCERCAMSHYAKSSSCYVCKKSTQGIFNNAEKLIYKISQIKKKKSKRANGQAHSLAHGHNHNQTDDITTITHSYGHDNNDEDNLNFLNNRERDYKLDLNEEGEDEYGFSKKTKGNNDNEILKNKKKKNKFQLQNDWIYPSDYKSYD